MSSSLHGLRHMRWLSLPFTQTKAAHYDLVSEYKAIARFLRQTMPSLSALAAPELDWYMVAAADTAATLAILRHAGLEQVAPNALYKNMSSATDTRHAWCFSPQSAFLCLPEPSGMELGEGDDRQFASQLARLRRKTPARGLILLYSATTLLDATPEHLAQLRANAQRVQRRFATLTLSPLPVYILVHDCDQLAGFDDFFAGADLANHATLGATLGGVDRSDSFTVRFKNLCQRLHCEAPHRMQAEPNQKKRRQLSNLPWHFERLHAALNAVCAEFSRGGNLQAALNLRGIYFSGNSAAMAQESATSFAHAFFHAHLPGLCSGNTAANALAHRQRRPRLAAAAMALAVAIASVWMQAYFTWRDDLDAAQKILQADAKEIHLPNDDGATPAGLDRVQTRLQSIRSAAALLPTGHTASWTRLGMHDPSATRSLQAMQADYLQHAWLPAFAGFVLNIASNDSLAYQTRFDALKACLMLLHDSRRDNEFLRRWIAHTPVFDDHPDIRSDAQLAINDYLDIAGDTAPDSRLSGLVASLQSALRTSNSADRIYEQWAAQYRDKYTNLITRHTDDAQLVFDDRHGSIPRVPLHYTSAFFSQLNFTSVARDAIASNQDRWVLGESAATLPDALPLIAGQMLSRYNRDYVDAWKQTYGAVALRRPTTLNELQRLLQRISAGDDSPISELLVATRNNFGAMQPDAGFRAVTESEQNRLAIALADLSDALTAEMDSSTPHAALSAESKSALRRMTHVATGLPSPVSRWVVQIKDDYQRLMQARKNASLHALWREEVYTPCTQMFANRYPFVAKSRNDARLADFTAYFKPGGIEDNFVKQHLGSLPAQAHRTHDNTARIAISDPARQMLQRGAEIRRAFFHHDQSRASFNIRVTPVLMDANLARFSLNGSGAGINYSHGPRLDTRLHWPDAAAGITTEFVTMDGATIQRNFRGEWALFHWLDSAASISSSAAGALVLRWRHGDLGVALEVFSNQQVNPMLRNLVGEYHCVPEL